MSSSFWDYRNLFFQKICFLKRKISYFRPKLGICDAEQCLHRRLLGHIDTVLRQKGGESANTRCSSPNQISLEIWEKGIDLYSYYYIIRQIIMTR
jgi:hypothetical protein